MAAECYISVRDMQYAHYCDGFKIVATTDIPCHLYLRWTTVKPQKHIVPILRRGVYMHGDTYFCFVAHKDNEQEEYGDTLTHTFIKRSWPICETRWFYFWGNVAGQTCHSTTAIFELHFDIIFQTFFGTLSNRTITKEHLLWPDCHNAPAGTVENWHNPPFTYLEARTGHPVLYHVHRSFLTFDTSLIPPGAVIAGATLSLYLQRKWDTYDPNYPDICITQGVQQDPVVPTDYGAQLPYTTIGGQRSITTMFTDQFNDIEFNSDGLPWINPTGITKLCIRQQMDILNLTFPAGDHRIIYYSAQKGAGFRPRLTICYPP